MSESTQTFFMYVGMATTAFFGFCLFCTVAFFTLLLEDRWREHGKAKFGQHQKAKKLVSVPDQEVIENFFPMETDQQRDERRSQEAISVLREKLKRNDETVANVAGWETEGPKYVPFDKNYHETVVYPAFNKEEPLDSRGAHKA